jgi:oxygen-independent coproporphyrinogen-3 oxidase
LQEIEMEMKKPQGMFKMDGMHRHGMAPEKAEPLDWHARITNNPLVDAFDEKMVVHPGAGAAPVAPECLEEKLNELTHTRRTMRSCAYIHIPYCETRCLYCMFYNKPYRNADESRIFTDHLIRELQLWADRPVQQMDPVHTVYFGGGTPTALEAGDIKRLLDAVHAYLPLANDAEITFEGRLSNFGIDKMEACISGGVNRFSLGVQTFDTKTRQAVGRRSTKEQLIAQLERLLSFDQAAVVVDLIYGFPYQTLETWVEDLCIVDELGLDGVDCYQLRVFPGSPLHKYIENGKLPAGPDHKLRAEMFAMSVEMLTNFNWNRLSVSHWGRTRRERNFYNYFAKTRSDNLAFGPGGGGSLHGCAYMGERRVDEWMKAVQEGRKPVSVLLNRAKHWDFNRAISEHMELNYFNLNKITQEFSSPLLQKHLEPVLANWTDAGLMVRRGDFHHLTVAGQFWQPRMTQLLMDITKNIEL